MSGPNYNLLFGQQGGGDGGGVIGGLIALIILVVIIAGIWKVFTKAGKPGWLAIIPIVNLIVLLDIAGRPVWWILLLLVPVVNLVVAIVVSIDVANKFGKGTGFGLGLAFLGFIFYPMLGFSDARYQTAH